MSPVEFRYATPDDAGVITDLIERAYRGPATAGQWDSESHLLTGPRTSTSEIRGLLLRDDSRFVLAEQDGRIAGCALIQANGAAPQAKNPCSPPMAANSAYFGMFAIDPGIRSAGLGKLVLAAAEARARELWSVRSMVMTVINVREQLIGWYQRRGYQLTGARLPFPFTETSGETTRDFDLVEMRKDLPEE